MHFVVFTVQLQQETIYTMEAINSIIGKETIDEFENRIAKVYFPSILHELFSFTIAYL